MTNGHLINELIKQIGSDKDKILFISDKKDASFNFNFSLKFDDLPYRKDKYDIVVAIMKKEFEKRILENILSLSKKYTILTIPFDMKLIQSTEKIIEHLCSVNLENRYDINKMSMPKNPILEYFEDQKIPYNQLFDLSHGQNQEVANEIFIITKDSSEMAKIKSLLDEKVLKSENFGSVLNLSLIQNLKKQIVEKENIIIKRNKDIEMLEKHKSDLEGITSHKNEEIEKLGSAIKSKGREIEKLNKELRHLSESLERLKELSREKNDEIRLKNDEIKKLKNELEEIHNSISYKVGSKVGKTTIGKLLKTSLKKI